MQALLNLSAARLVAASSSEVEADQRWAVSAVPVVADGGGDGIAHGPMAGVEAAVDADVEGHAGPVHGVE